jgi:hypothetical protein
MVYVFAERSVAAEEHINFQWGVGNTVGSVIKRHKKRDSDII